MFNKLCLCCCITAQSVFFEKLLQTAQVPAVSQAPVVPLTTTNEPISCPAASGNDTDDVSHNLLASTLRLAHFDTLMEHQVPEFSVF